jgi:hypothetical protein
LNSYSWISWPADTLRKTYPSGFSAA